MARCSNCGTENPETNRYCAECGTKLERPAEQPPEAIEIPAPTFAAAPQEPVSLPPRDPADLPPTDPEWRMSAPEPYVPTQGRRRWLWIIGGVLGVCLLLCVGVVVWGSTIGRPTLDALGTQIVVEATRQAVGVGTPPVGQ